MDGILEVRQHIISFYKKFDIAINYIVKFLVGLFLFSRINSLGLYREEFEILFGSATGTTYLLLVSLIFTILPPSLALLLMAVAIAIQLSAVVEVAIFVFLLLVLIIVFYARLSPRQSMLIVAIVCGFYFRIPYAVVMYAGLYFGIMSIIPVVIGVAVWNFLPFFIELAGYAPIHEELDLFEIPMVILDIFGDIFTALTTDFNWVLIGFVFAMMILAVHLISLVAIDYAKDIAIAIGGVVGIICMIMVTVAMGLDMGVGGIIISVISSMVIMYIIKFFDKALDYKRVERVEFEDEDNLYYVKIVPKIVKPRPEPKRRVARPQPPGQRAAGAYRGGPIDEEE